MSAHAMPALRILPFPDDLDLPAIASLMAASDPWRTLAAAPSRAWRC